MTATTEILRCVYRESGRNGAGPALAQCPEAADWQCLRCGLGYCHQHAIWHRRAQKLEAAPGPEAARAQVALALALQGIVAGRPETER